MSDPASITLSREGVSVTVKVGDVVPMTDGSLWKISEMMEPYCGQPTFRLKRDAAFSARFRLDGIPLVTGGAPWIDLAALAAPARAAPAVPVERVQELIAAALQLKESAKAHGGYADGVRW